MAPEDMSQLGMRDYSNLTIAKRSREKEEKGFVAGVAHAEAVSEAKKRQKESK